VLWRLRAEAPQEKKFDLREVQDKIAEFRRQGNAVGSAGFGISTQIAATLLPRSSSTPPLALGMIYPAATQLNAEALTLTMNQGIARCASQNENDWEPMPLIMAV
jgi:hypothetical protein